MGALVRRAIAFALMLTAFTPAASARTPAEEQRPTQRTYRGVTRQGGAGDGAGHSIGALLVDAARGMFRSFDAIIPASWSHGGFSQDFLNNCTTGYKCVGVRDILFWRPNANPKVVNEWIKPLEGFNTLQNDS